MKTTDTEIIRRAIKDHGLWTKKASEGPSSLMRAASNAIYFTDTYHSELQAMLVGKFRSEVKTADNCLRHLIDKEDHNLFLRNPCHPHFETLNLELLAQLFRRRIKLYYLNGQILSTSTFMKKFPETIRIVKLGANNYVSATTDKLQDMYIECQNMVLSSIESALDNSSFVFQELNGGKLLNFERIRDKAAALSVQRSVNRKPEFDFKAFLYTNPPTSESNTNNSFSQSDKQSIKMDSFGIDVVSMPPNRRNENQCQSNNSSLSFGPDISGAPMGQPKSTSHVEIVKLRLPASTNKEEVFNPYSRNMNITNTPQMLQSFSQKALSTNLNLGLSIQANNIESIIQGLDKNNHPRANETKLDHILNPRPKASDYIEPEAHPPWTRQEQPVQDLTWQNSRRRPDVPFPGGNFFNEFETRNIEREKPSSMNNYMGRPINVHNEKPERHLPIFPQDAQGDPFSEKLYRHRVPNNDNFSNKQPRPFDHAEEFQPSHSKKTRNWNELQMEDYGFPTPNYPHFTKDPYFRNHQETFNRATEPKESAPNAHFLLTQKSQIPPAQPIHPSHPSRAEKPKPSKKNKKHRFRERHDSELFTGALKFFDQKNGFGFMTIQNEDKPYDVFVYRVEFQRAKLGLDEIIKVVRSGKRVLFRFQVAHYCGKYEMSKKAINLALLETR